MASRGVDGESWAPKESNVLLEQITSLIRAELEGGFPLMMPVASTGVIKPTDYVNSVDAAEKDVLWTESAAGTRRLLPGESIDVTGAGRGIRPVI